ncbi:MAG: hypothetical protein AAGD00_10180 [Planctomycetota bacterium]
MTETAAPRDNAIEEQGLITDGVACVSCGQDLGGLDPGGVCPECGASIKRSLAGPRLFYAGPAWLERIARGARLSFMGLVATLIVSVVGVSALLVLSIVERAQGFGSGAYTTPIAYAFGLLLLLAIFASAAGGWFATTPQPGMGVVRQRKNHAKRARVLFVISGGAVLLNLMLTFTGVWSAVGQRWGWVWQDGIVSFVSAIALTALVFAISAWSRHLRTLSARIRPRSLYTRWRRFSQMVSVGAWTATVAACGFVVLAHVAMPIVARLPASAQILAVPVGLTIVGIVFSSLLIGVYWFALAIRAMQLTRVSQRAFEAVHEKSLLVDQSS